MKIEKIEINKLKPATYNPRQISTKQYNDLKESIERFGLVDPIVVNKDMTIIGGHQRYKIWKEKAKKSNVKDITIPCVVLELNKEQERELNVRLNKSGGDFDMDILANEFNIDELVDWGFKHIDLGLNIDKIVEGNTEDDHIPEVKESRVKLGDVWELGKHRLMCGDSTKESDVNKLMNGQKADMVFTDPPYNIDFKDSKNRKIKNDNLGVDFENFILNTFKTILSSITKGYVYLCFSQKFIFDYLKAIQKNNLKDLDIIIWYKDTTMRLGKDYRNYYEPIFLFRINEPVFYGKREYEKNVWEINSIHSASSKDDNNKSWFKGGAKNLTLHPTQKPVELSETAIKNTSIKNNIVLDLFLGSGSTLIACEKTNRICYGMELDTKYCDVIIERWEQFTGQKATKL